MRKRRGRGGCWTQQSGTDGEWKVDVSVHPDSASRSRRSCQLVTATGQGLYTPRRSVGGVEM